MKRLALASAAVIAMTGIGVAQESGPFNQNEAGNYSLEQANRANERYYSDYDRPIYRAPAYRDHDAYASYYGPGYGPYRHHRRHYDQGGAFSVIIGGGGWTGYDGAPYGNPSYYGW